MPVIKKTRDNKCWRECREKGTLVHCWSDCELGQPLLEKSMEVPKNIKVLKIANLLLSIYSKK